MKTLFHGFSCLMLFAAAASAQPVINTVVNSASYGMTGLPNEGVAQGSIATAFGTGFGPGGVQQVSALPLNTTFEGLSAKITVSGTTVDVYPVQIANGTQFSFVVPSETPTGTGTLVATIGGQSSAPAPIKIVPNNLGLYSVNFSGEGPGVVDDATFNRITVTNSAKPGDAVVIWGTGLGPVEGSPADVPSETDRVLEVDPLEVYIGGKLATVSYQGRTPCCVGVDQINAVVPEDVSGCAVPVVVKAGAVVSNFTTISVAENGGTCSDPLLSADRINLIQQGGSLKSGGVVLSRINITPVPGLPAQNIDTASASFENWTWTDLLSGAASDFVRMIGSCVVTTYREGEAQGPGNFGTPLDAGSSLALAAPGGPRTLNKAPTGGYTTPVDPFFQAWLEPGNYTITGPGGTDVGTFSQGFTIPTMLTWTNQDAITTVNRSQGLTVTWTGGGTDNYVMISGSSTATGLEGTPTAAFTCWEEGSAGTFTVPSYVLSSLPASGSGEDAGMLMVGSVADPTPFSPVPSGLDEAYVLSTVFNGKMVTYQ